MNGTYAMSTCAAVNVVTRPHVNHKSLRSSFLGHKLKGSGTDVTYQTELAEEERAIGELPQGSFYFIQRSN